MRSGRRTAAVLPRMQSRCFRSPRQYYVTSGTSEHDKKSCASIWVGTSLDEPKDSQQRRNRVVGAVSVNQVSRSERNVQGTFLPKRAALGNARPAPES